MKFFDNRARIAELQAEVKFLRAQNQTLEWKNTELEKEVRAERNKKDKFVTQYCNQISQKNGLYGVFEEKKAEKKESQPRSLTPKDEEKLNFFAEQMRAEDLQNDVERPLDFYLNQIKQPDNLDYYLQLN